MKSLNIKPKLLFTFLIIGMLCTIPPGIAVYFKARSTIEKKTLDSLSSIRAEKKNQIEGYFDTIRKQVKTFSKDMMIINASRDFNKVFNNYIPGKKQHSLAANRKNLKNYYEAEFLAKLKRNKNISFDASEYVERLSDTAIFLQNSYIASNPNPLGSKLNLDQAPDESEYTKIHSLYHPTLREYIRSFGYYDIFLIDANTANIVYTTSKEVDFATNLSRGMYKGSNLARSFKASQDSSDPDFAYLAL